jgi:hypothetical protein
VDRKNFGSGYWIDDLPEPFETVEDVEDLMWWVDALKAKREDVKKPSRSGIIQKIDTKEPMQQI